MHTPHRFPLFLAILGLGLVLTEPAFAAASDPVYQMQVSSQGLRSPLIAPTLGAFAVSSRAVGANFQLTPPTSNSAGAFSFTSSDSSVASITGDWVSVLKAGATVITVRQVATATYDTASTTASFVVSAPLPAGYVSSGGLTWTLPTARLDQPTAVSYCTTSAFNGTTGWRLPTWVELQGLTANVSQLGLAGKGWPLAMSQPYGLVRSSTASSNPGYYKGCRLSLNDCQIDQPGTNAYYEAYVSCVK